MPLVVGVLLSCVVWGLADISSIFVLLEVGVCVLFTLYSRLSAVAWHVLHEASGDGMQEAGKGASAFRADRRTQVGVQKHHL